ncbi:MAG: pilus assembly protein [Planctomycetia bacterium]|nr:pilus assembly protein [Planctomycetia bacterium]
MRALADCPTNDAGTMQTNQVTPEAATPAQAAPRARRGAVAVEAAIVMTVLVVLVMGMWEAGRLLQMSRILEDAAREGARMAAGGTNNNTAVTVSMVQQAVKDYMTMAGVPAAAVSGCQVTVTNNSGNSWTDPTDAQPLDEITVKVVIPSGTAFNSLKFISTAFTGITQLSASARWMSANDSNVTLSSQLPY